VNNFENTLERMKLILNVKTDAEVAEAIGMKPSALANRKKTGSIPFDIYLKTIKSLNVNLNWLIDGDGPIYNDVSKSQIENNSLSKNEPSRDTGNSNITKVIIEHQGIIKRFKDPEKGLENNEHLLGIEDASHELYKKVSDYLKATHDAAKIMQEEISKKTSKSAKNGTEDGNA